MPDHHKSKSLRHSELFHRAIRLVALLVVGPVLCAIVRPATADDSQRDAIELITQTAGDICNNISLEGSSRELALSGEAGAKLNKLLRGLVELGIEGSADLRDEEFEGVLREDLGRLLIENPNLIEKSECRREIYFDLVERLLPPATFLQSDEPTREAKLRYLEKAFQRNDAANMRTALASALGSTDPEFKRSAVRLAFESEVPDLQNAAMVAVVRKSRVLPGNASIEDSFKHRYEFPFQVEISNFDEETASFQGTFLAQFLEEKPAQSPGNGSVSGTTLAFGNNRCSLVCSLASSKGSQYCTGNLTCQRVRLGPSVKIMATYSIAMPLF